MVNKDMSVMKDEAYLRGVISCGRVLVLTRHVVDRSREDGRDML